MAWKIEFARSAEKELSKIESQTTRRVLRFLKERVANDPRSVGLTWMKISQWKLSYMVFLPARAGSMSAL